MATPKDKLNKAHEQKAHSDTAVAHNQRASWQEALDRHVSIPASRATEAAEVFRSFAGSWAGTYEMGLGATTQQSGAVGVPALQRKINRLGQPGPPEINFRPYDWGTHRFGPKGPSLLGHPISFEIIGPTQKTHHNDWQWQVKDNSAHPGNGDGLSIDMEGADDVSATSPIGGPTTQTGVNNAVGGVTVFADYYGFTDLSEFPGGLYMVVTMGGGIGTLDNPAGDGGVGDGLIGDPAPPGPGVRVGAIPLTISAKTEIFRVVSMDDSAKSITLDPGKRLATYFDITGTIPIIRSIMLIAPKATRLVAVPGSGLSGVPTTFAVVPPERMLLNDYTPPLAAWTGGALPQGGSYDPWMGPFEYDPGQAGDVDKYAFRPRLPIETPRETSGAWHPDSFTVAPTYIEKAAPDHILPLEPGVGYTPAAKDAVDRIVNIHEVELVGNATTFDLATGTWVADPGYEWLMGYHEVVGEDIFGGNVTGLQIARIPEVNPTTGVPFYAPPQAMSAQTNPMTANDGIRYKLTWHDPIESLWLTPHPSIDKISQARLTNLIDPDWLDKSHSLKQSNDTPDGRPFTHTRPDKAIFDTSTSNSGGSGSNADPGNLNDLGFRMVLFAAKDGGAGFLIPDFDNPISAREAIIDPTKLTEEQWWDVDYSAGLVTLSHIPRSGGALTPGAVTIPLLVVGGFPTAGEGFTWDNNGGIGPFTITRNDPGGNFLTDGFKVGRKFTVSEATNATNNQTYTLVSVTATQLEVHHPDNANGRPFANETDDNTAKITSGDNPRNEVVLFASCVPYSREAGQLGANIRVTAGQNDVLSLACGLGAGGANADVFSERRFWQLQGDNTSPQTINSGLHQTIDLLDPVNATEIPTEGFIEIVQGLDPEGPPAFLDGDRKSVSTFGYRYSANTGVGGGTRLENCFGGVGVNTITVNSDNPYIAVLRRDVVLPSTANGQVGTDYSHDVTYGAASRATALRFRHARLTKQIDGSVVVEGLDELAQQHEKLFKDVLSSWVISGFDVTYPAGLVVDFAAGVVLIDGVRSEMAPSSITLPAIDASYYIYIEPQGGDPACPAITAQVGMPLPENNCVLLGIVEVSGIGTTLETFVDLRYFLRDIDLRDDILVGQPPYGHPTIPSTAHPHFTEMADAVAYACEVMRYREPQTPGDGVFGRYVKIKVIGATTEQDEKCPIKFTSDGIIIEGTAAKLDGSHLISGWQIANQQAVAWAANAPLFDLNGHNNLHFRDLVLEYRDLGQPDPSKLLRAAFVNGAGQWSSCSFIKMENVYLVNFHESLTSTFVAANAFIHFTQGTARNWHIKDCSTQSTDVGIYFGGDHTDGITVEAVYDVIIENCFISGVWEIGDDTLVGDHRVQFQQGLNSLGQPEPYGGIILVTKGNGSGNIVRGCHITNWAGFGILDNFGGSHLYEGNHINQTGDVGIYVGSAAMFFSGTGSQNRIAHNVLEEVHGLDLTGPPGTVNQFAVDSVPVADKRGIFVQDSSETTIIGNYVEISQPSVTRDNDIWVGGISCVAIGNVLFSSSAFSSTDAVDFIFADNNVVGGGDFQGSPTIASNCVFGGQVRVSDLSFILNSYLKATITSTGTNCIIGNNLINDPVISQGVVLGAKNVFSDNIYQGSDDGAIVFIEDDCVVSGNVMIAGQFELTGKTNIVVSGNRAEGLSYDPNSGAGTQDNTVISGNLFTQGIIFHLPVGRNLKYSVIAGNTAAGMSVVDGAGAGENDKNCIVGNNIIDPLALGTSNLQVVGDRNQIVGNHIDGSAQIGSTSTAAHANVFANNYMVTLIDTGVPIPAYGQGVANFNVNLIVYGSDNIIDGNMCASGGVYAPATSSDNIITGNRFALTGNGSSLFAGDNNVITGNYFFDDTAENVGLVLGGDNNTVSGNMLDEGRIDCQGADCVVSGNLVGSDDGWNPAEILVSGVRANINGNSVTGGIHLLSGSDGSSVIGNTLDHATADLEVDNGADGIIIHGNNLRGAGQSIITDGADTVIDGNWIANGVLISSAAIQSVVSGNRMGGDFISNAPDVTISGNYVGGSTGLDSNGMSAIISGNRIEGGDFLVDGDSSVLTGNHTQGTKGSLVVSADDCTIHGNYIHGAATVSTTKKNPVISGNYFVSSLTAKLVTDYVIIGNVVLGDIVVDDSSVTPTPGPGIIIGNHALRITGTPGGAGAAIPAEGYVVLGNKVGNTNTIFAVDPNDDSVGSTVPNQILDFNVTK